MTLPIEVVSVKVITAPYSAEISWVTLYATLNEETYSFQYSTEMSLQNT